MEHKHKLRFIRRGVEFVSIEGFPYINTWDFQCTRCWVTIRVDREAWRNRLIGRRGIIEWKI